MEVKKVKKVTAIMSYILCSCRTCGDNYLLVHYSLHVYASKV